MSTISELLIKIGADSSGLRKELGESKTAINQTFGDVKPLDTMQGALTSTTSKVEGLIGSFTKFAGVVAGGFGLTSLKFNTVEELVRAIGLPKCKICTHCFDGSSHE